MNSSNSPNGFLPDDVVLQILARLPIKSLFRFKSVCKLWRRLPSEKHFIDLYFQTSAKDPTLLIEIPDSIHLSSHLVSIDRFREVTTLSLDFLNDRVKIRASCHGLLCCASLRNRGVYYVCNPMTREVRVLPRTRERPFTRCQPEYEATLVGLAFDPFSWRFHVVLAGFHRHFGYRPQDQLVCQVFDSRNNAWSRSISCLYEEFTHMNRSQVVFSSNSLHWLTHSCTYVLAFDLKGGVWGKIWLPDEVLLSRNGSRIYLLELDGLVSVVQISGVWMSVWVLRDHGTEQWSLVDKVHLRCINGYTASVFPICQSRDVIFMATQKKVLMYDRNGKMWKEIHGVRGASTYPLWFLSYAFKSSLFPCRH
ncbi:F-box protein At5g49610 [Elaeis guineensis]|uniref:F-box protein At5g49610 n=1 Tax=Elaeis guineensis var. tenera TaxID=51953 RepID=A0A6J0PN93_ELAGV|nr:F-box protein At5g49610 [Elaeis guineensis]